MQELKSAHQLKYDEVLDRLSSLQASAGQQLQTQLKEKDAIISRLQHQLVDVLCFSTNASKQAK